MNRVFNKHIKKNLYACRLDERTKRTKKRTATVVTVATITNHVIQQQ